MSPVKDVQLLFLLLQWPHFINLFIAAIDMAKLTHQYNLDVPFELCFKYPLENGFTFKELTPENVKQFQSFLNKVSNMTVSQVDMAFSRQPDSADTYKGMQVYHYEVTRAFRIHVVNEAGFFKIIRLDPRHQFHRV